MLDGQKSKIRIRITSIYIVAFLLIFVWGIMTYQAAAYDEVTDVSVTVGYWGGKEYTKKQATLSEIVSACGTHREIYTWVNGGESPGTTEAEGIYISDIMDYCGIDMGSVEYYNFYTRDGATYGGANQQWTTGQLFGSRYTFKDVFFRAINDYNSDREDYVKNPEAHFTVDDIYSYENKRYTDKAWNSREKVEPMLALRTKSNTWKGYAPASQLDFSNMQETGKPILVFGQVGKNDITRNQMAQMVTKVHIWFEGSPKITLDKTSLKGKIGSKKNIKVRVSTPDEYLTKQILNEISLKSSDTSVAKVNKDGTVTIKGKGNAAITVSYNGTNYGSVAVSGTGDNKKDDEKKPDDEKKGHGKGSGSSEGNGNGSSSGNNNGTGAGTGTGNNSNTGSGDSGGDATGLSNNNNASKSISVSKADGASDRIGSAGGTASGSDVNGEKIYKISQSENVLKESLAGSSLLRWILLIMGISLLIGAVGTTVSYRSQTNWINQARRVYANK